MNGNGNGGGNGGQDQGGFNAQKAAAPANGGNFNGAVKPKDSLPGTHVNMQAKMVLRSFSF